MRSEYRNLLGAFVQAFAAFSAEFRGFPIGHQAFVVELNVAVLEILAGTVNPNIVQQKKIGGDIHLVRAGHAVAAAGAVKIFQTLDLAQHGADVFGFDSG